jgi:hypothetical protein
MHLNPSIKAQREFDVAARRNPLAVLATGLSLRNRGDGAGRFGAGGSTDLSAMSRTQHSLDNIEKLAELLGLAPGRQALYPLWGKAP